MNVIIIRGFGIYTNFYGVILEGNWKNNILNGIGIEINKNGIFYQGEFKIIKNMDLDFIDGMMELFIMENGKIMK